ncbi:MAG: hypothetical protein A2Z20_10790 [Bdellovibrionales bacterium RBG_16_40_8]|nr:MAG: hypothetical protein A2Z20_10790 [Bdellovibrionales bacterium RBG_16_40_8]
MNPFELAVNNSIGLFFALWPQPTPPNEKLLSAKIVAHRGVHENSLAIENSREAFQLAVNNKLWAIEFDVRFTQDNIPIISHDPDNGRLFGCPDIVFAQVDFLTLRKKLPQIISLQEVVAEFGRKIHFMIEIKDSLHHSPLRIKSLQQILATLTPKKDYHLLSLDPDYLEALTFFAPKDAMMDVIWLDSKKIMKKNNELNHGAIAGHFLFFNKTQIKDLQEKNKLVGVGFLDSRNSFYREINRGVDFVFTDKPLRLKKVIFT